MELSMKEVRATSSRHEDWTPLLVLAVQEVFELMLGCQLAVSASEEEVGLNMTSMVGFAGQFCGVLSLRCNEKSSALMASKMLGVELGKGSHEISDALGEICSMVAGNFKSKISVLSEGCMLSLPSVTTGTGYSLQSPVGDPGLEVKMLFEGMPIIISLQIGSQP